MTQVNQSSSTAKVRTQKNIISMTQGTAVSDGDGVKLTRIIGTDQLTMLDPFLLLDCFESDVAQDYIGGFPTHPHRGFETVTYLLNGRMRHKDSKGNEGVIEPGGVQWMTAGKGILHSEMPEQHNGLLQGFQLWLNLPQSAKMTEPAYQEFSVDKIALEERSDGSKIRVIAGKTDGGTLGPVINRYTQPIYIDVTLAPGGTFTQDIPPEHSTFVYIIEGALGAGQPIQHIDGKTLAVFGTGDQISLTSESATTRFLLVAAKRLNQTVVRGGPFVMNTREELNQAFEDFRLGKF